jgi:hypothetical protein
VDRFDLLALIVDDYERKHDANFFRVLFDPLG